MSSRPWPVRPGTDIAYGDEINFGAEYRALPLDENLAAGARYANCMKGGFSAAAVRYSAYAAYAFRAGGRWAYRGGFRGRRKRRAGAQEPFGSLRETGDR